MENGKRGTGNSTDTLIPGYILRQPEWKETSFQSWHFLFFPLYFEVFEKIERLFQEAKFDRNKAYELKRELDKWGLFEKYEDRFLDLFKKQ